jgi:hypothetical protein
MYYNELECLLQTMNKMMMKMYKRRFNEKIITSNLVNVSFCKLKKSPATTTEKKRIKIYSFSY